MGNILHQLEAAEDDANLAFLRSEVARLRLTDAEREAVEWIVENVRLTVGVDRAATLRSLLERIGGER